CAQLQRPDQAGSGLEAAVCVSERGRARRHREARRVSFRLTGACGCGAVRFEVTAPPVSALYCHCTRCQRRSGTAASANALVAPGSFVISAGEDRLRAWKPEGGGEKWFCGDCGSALFTRRADDPSIVG